MKFLSDTMKITIGIVAAVVALAALLSFGPVQALLAERFGVGPYETTSEKPVAFTVIDRDGARYAFAVPRVYLVERIAPGAALEASIGRPAFQLSLDQDVATACRARESCADDADIEVAFPYPYEIGDGAPPAVAHEVRESDIAGFMLTVTGGAGGATGGFKTETRRYRAEQGARVPRVDCDMVVAGDIESGICRAAVRWREGAYAQVQFSARRRADVHALADAAVTLLDRFAAPEGR